MYSGGPSIGTMGHYTPAEPDPRLPPAVGNPGGPADTTLPDLAQLSISPPPPDSLLFASVDPAVLLSPRSTPSPLPSDSSAPLPRRTRYVRVRGQREPVPVSITVNVNVSAGTAPVYVTAGLTNPPATPQGGRANNQSRHTVHTTTPIHEGSTAPGAVPTAPSSRGVQSEPVSGLVAPDQVTPWDISREP